MSVFEKMPDNFKKHSKNFVTSSNYLTPQFEGVQKALQDSYMPGIQGDHQLQLCKSIMFLDMEVTKMVL